MFRKSLIALTALATSAAHAKTVPENWRPCATGIRHEEPSFDEIPAWAAAPSLCPYYEGEPRLLAMHGLCNAKFHRVVMCWPAWQYSVNESWNEPWFKVCAAYELTH